MPAAKLREPEELYSPPEAWEKRIEKVASDIAGGLSAESARDFTRQFLAAVTQARLEGDLRPINVVIEAWYRTMLFITRPKFAEKWSEAEETDGPALTLEDIRQRRAQRAR